MNLLNRVADLDRQHTVLRLKKPPRPLPFIINETELFLRERHHSVRNINSYYIHELLVIDKF